MTRARGVTAEDRLGPHSRYRTNPHRTTSAALDSVFSELIGREYIGLTHHVTRAGDLHILTGRFMQGACSVSIRLGFCHVAKGARFYAGTLCGEVRPGVDIPPQDASSS